VGVRGSNFAKSGVIVRKVGPVCGRKTPIDPPGIDAVVGLGLDHANEGVLAWFEAFRGD
jgi:hypothetical protein